jgi:3-oxoadipate enol-lactonase
VTATLTTSQGVRLTYELVGSGPTIAFVNSFLMPASGWAAFTLDLRERNRLLTYDLGPDSWSTGTVPAFERYVDDLDELLDAVEVESTYLLGHSSGTQIAIAYAAARPERVRGLVLAGPSANPRGGERRRELVAGWRSAYLAGGFEGLFDALWPIVHSEVTLRRAGEMARRIMRHRFVAMNAGSDPLPLFALSDSHQVAFAPDWEAIAAPTLILVGEDDCVSTASAVRETRELIRGSEVVVLEHAGHVVYLEATAAFQREVQRFVDRVEAGAARQVSESGRR